MTNNVSVPSILCPLPFGTFPMPWQRRPILLVKDRLQILSCLGWFFAVGSTLVSYLCLFQVPCWLGAPTGAVGTLWVLWWSGVDPGYGTVGNGLTLWGGRCRGRDHPGIWGHPWWWIHPRRWVLPGRNHPWRLGVYRDGFHPCRLVWHRQWCGWYWMWDLWGCFWVPITKYVS